LQNFYIHKQLVTHYCICLEKHTWGALPYNYLCLFFCLEDTLFSMERVAPYLAIVRVNKKLLSAPLIFIL